MGPDGTPEVPRDGSSEPSKNVDEARVGQEADKWLTGVLSLLSWTRSKV